MRAELIIDNQSAGKFDFVVAPRSGDTVTLKEQTATVQEFNHNLDGNRLQVLCKGSAKAQQPQRAAQTQQQPPARQTRPAEQPEAKKES